MPPETNDLEPLPRRRPKLHPEAPPPLEPAPPPRPVFRLRQDVPAPSEGPSKKDQLREIFFINWQAQNPGGKADSEDFERAYGDYQIKQFEAKGYYRDRERSTPLWPIVRRLLLVALLLAAAISAFNWVRTKSEARRPVPAKTSSTGAGAPGGFALGRNDAVPTAKRVLLQTGSPIGFRSPARERRDLLPSRCSCSGLQRTCFLGVEEVGRALRARPADGHSFNRARSAALGSGRGSRPAAP